MKNKVTPLWMRNRFGVGLGVALTVLSLGRQAAAQSEPASEGKGAEGKHPGLTVDEERYAWLDTRLLEVGKATERWHTGWTWGFGILAAGNLGIAAAAPTEPQRQFASVTAATTFLGLVSTLSQPYTWGGAQELLGSYDASTPLGQYERRRRAEYILYATASEEKYWHSPVPHIAGLLAGGASAAVLMGIYKQTAFGLAAAGASVVGVELQIWSRPFSATKAWHEYQARYGDEKPAEVGPDAIDMFSVSLSVTPNGLAAAGTF